MQGDPADPADPSGRAALALAESGGRAALALQRESLGRAMVGLTEQRAAVDELRSGLAELQERRRSIFGPAPAVQAKGQERRHSPWR